MCDEVRTIIIDNGSGIVKGGFGGDTIPSIRMQCFVGPSIFNTRSVFSIDEQPTVGSESPITDGVINREDMTLIWDHIFSSLPHERDRPIQSSEHPILMTEPIRNPPKNKENLVEYLFEHYSVPSFLIANDCVLGLFGSGRITGFTLDCGENLTQFAPVYEGHTITYATIRQSYGGKQLTEAFTTLLQREHRSAYEHTLDQLNYSELKKKHCYVCQNFETEMKKQMLELQNQDQSEYTIPDIIGKSPVRFKTGEILFNPSLDLKADVSNQLKIFPLDQACYFSIQNIDYELRKSMYSNIVLSGGTTMLPGLNDRLKLILKSYAPPTDEVNVIASPQRENGAWVGGSVFSTLDSFQQMLISRVEYNEVGKSIIHRKSL